MIFENDCLVLGDCIPKEGLYLFSIEKSDFDKPYPRPWPGICNCPKKKDLC